MYTTKQFELYTLYGISDITFLLVTKGEIKMTKKLSTLYKKNMYSW